MFSWKSPTNDIAVLFAIYNISLYESLIWPYFGSYFALKNSLEKQFIEKQFRFIEKQFQARGVDAEVVKFKNYFKFKKVIEVLLKLWWC